MTDGLLQHRVFVNKDLVLFQQSDTRKEILYFLKSLNDATIDTTNRIDVHISPEVQEILSLLDKVDGLVDENPPVANEKSRFGNPAFRSFYDSLKERLNDWQSTLVPTNSEELVEYFVESWGNRTRIDYGSGHELNFICWLLCLKKRGILHASDARTCVLRIFNRYIQVMRRLQSTYWLEPAGSHGVWGLDDYHFLPFLFGSAQLLHHKHLRPKSIHDNDILEMYGDDYMYLACIRFVNSVKTASLRWHSPMLDDISAAKSWAKINAGMFKMYEAEVLGKLPVMQHFLFGSMLTPHPDMTRDQSSAQEVHIHDAWGDCCGIKVPSAIAASDLNHSHSLRPVPFD